MLSRQADEDYKDIAEQVLMDVLTEDDCESSGGKPEMVYLHVKLAFITSNDFHRAQSV